MATVIGTITIQATVTDAQGGTLTSTIYIDDVVLAVANSYTWDTTAVDDISHTIEAKATDSGGLTGSDLVTVTMDNVEDPPHYRARTNMPNSWHF